MIGIITAMESEAERLKSDIVSPVIKEISGVRFILGKLYDKDICLAVSGIGKVLAAITTEAMILNFKPGFILSAGVAGALNYKLDIGDVAIAESHVQHDLDTTAIGDPKGLVSGINKIYFESDIELVKILETSAKNIGINYVKGVIASGDKFIKDDEGKSIKNEFNAIACEMESASIATVCYVNKVKNVCFRAISDKGDKNSGNDYTKFLKKACDSSYFMIKEFVKIA